MLRGTWRRTDEKLAERALHDQEVVQELNEYDKAVNPALDDFKSDGPSSPMFGSNRSRFALGAFSGENPTRRSPSSART